MDFITEFVTDLATAAIGIAVPIGVAYVWKFTGLKENSNAQLAVSTALQNAAGIAINHGIENGDALLQKAEVKNVALAKGVDYVNTVVPGQLALLGVTPSELADKVVATVANKIHPAIAADVATTSTVIVSKA